MKKYILLCITSMLILFNTIALAQNQSIIETDIKNSYAELNKLISDIGSYQQRKNYLTSLQKLTDDFNYLSIVETNPNNKKKLDLLALVLMEQLNAQHRNGIDLNGNFGSNLLTDINNVSLINTRVIPALTNKGTEKIVVNITDTKALSAGPLSNYLLKFDSRTHYKITRISDGRLVYSGDIPSFPQTIPINGFNITIQKGMIPFQ